MSQLGVILQESVVRERETRTILCFLREQMDGVDGARRRRRSLKERLGLKGIGCCGTTWVFGGTNVRDNNIVVDGNDDEEEEDVVVQRRRRRRRRGCYRCGPGPGSTGSQPGSALREPGFVGFGYELSCRVGSWETPSCVAWTGESGNSGAHRHRRRNRSGDYDSTGNTVQGFVDEIAGGNERWRWGDDDDDREGERERERWSGREWFGVLRVHGEEERRSVHTMWAHFLQGVFEGALVESRFVSPLQPFDPRDPWHFLIPSSSTWCLLIRHKLCFFFYIVFLISYCYCGGDFPKEFNTVILFYCVKWNLMDLLCILVLFNTTTITRLEV